MYTDVNQSAAYLVSPEVTLPHNRVHCLSFWYYVYGRPAAAILRVYIRRDQAYSRPEWSRATAAENQWLRGEVTISTNAPLQVCCSCVIVMLIFVKLIFTDNDILTEWQVSVKRKYMLQPQSHDRDINQC